MNLQFLTGKHFLKRASSCGIAFLAAGFLICIIGFGMAQFHLDHLATDGKAKWYQTVHVRDNVFSLGIRTDNGNYVTGFSTKLP